jgi:hypothetical protein
MASSSSGSDSHGSLAESAVTLEGGITDYLSDKSGAELLRQAEAKAALLMLHEAGELESRAERQALVSQVAHFCPPKSWAATEMRSTAPMAPFTRN